MEEDVDNVTELAANLFLSLTLKNHYTETVIQETLDKTYHAFSICKDKFYSRLDDYSPTEEQKQSVVNGFNKSFQGITVAQDTKCGVLASAECGTKYFKEHMNIVLPVEYETIADNGHSIGTYFGYLRVNVVQLRNS